MDCNISFHIKTISVSLGKKLQFQFCLNELYSPISSIFSFIQFNYLLIFRQITNPQLGNPVKFVHLYISIICDGWLIFFMTMTISWCTSSTSNISDIYNITLFILKVLTNTSFNGMKFIFIYIIFTKLHIIWKWINMKKLTNEIVFDTHVDSY